MIDCLFWLDFVLPFETDSSVSLKFVAGYFYPAHRHFELCSLLTVQFSKNQAPLRATFDSLSHQISFVKYFFEFFSKNFHRPKIVLAAPMFLSQNNKALPLPKR